MSQVANPKPKPAPGQPVRRSAAFISPLSASARSFRLEHPETPRVSLCCATKVAGLRARHSVRAAVCPRFFSNGAHGVTRPTMSRNLLVTALVAAEVSPLILPGRKSEPTHFGCHRAMDSWHQPAPHIGGFAWNLRSVAASRQSAANFASEKWQALGRDAATD